MEGTNEFQKEFFKKHRYHDVIIKLLSAEEQTQLPLTGHCMRPLLRENDLITVTPIRVEELICGNVALYHINGRLKAHRYIKSIILKNKKYLITKSDRRYFYDKPVPISKFLGIITQINRGNKIINYNSKKWKRINFVLGKFSTHISLLERPLMFLIRLPRKCASKVFRLIMGINYRAYMESRKNIDKTPNL